MRKYTGVETLYEEAEEKRKAEEFKQWQPSVVTREQRREVIGNYELVDLSTAVFSYLNNNINQFNVIYIVDNVQQRQQQQQLM